MVVQQVADPPELGEAVTLPDDPVSSDERVARAVEWLGSGKLVVLIDDLSEHPRCELAMAAAEADGVHVAFMTRYGTGFISVALPSSRADQLQLPPIGDSEQGSRVAFGVTVDARNGVSTGISAADRAHTMRELASSSSSPDDFSRPGHVVTIRTADHGVLARPALSEAAVELVAMAGLPAAAAHVALVSERDPRQLADASEAATFALAHGLCTVRATDVVRHAGQRPQHVTQVGTVHVAVADTDYAAIALRSGHDQRDHLALVLGAVEDGDVVDVHQHRECALSAVFGTAGCDCRARLDASLATVAARGRGVVLYLADRVPGASLLERFPAGSASGAPGSHRGMRSRGADPRDTLLATQLLAGIGVRRATVHVFEHGRLPS